MHTWLLAPVCLCVFMAPEDKRFRRAYDVGFLTQPVPQLPARSWPRAGEMRLGVWEPPSRGVPISFTSEVAEEEGGLLVPPGMGLSPEAIVQLIRRNVDEDSWANDLNSIAADGARITVTQTPGAHEAIAKLLGGLRARRGLLVTVDVACVPTAALGELAGAPGPWFAARDFDAVLERAGARGTRVTLTAYNEQRVSALAGHRSARVTDSEVNQTGIVPVLNPVVEKLPFGVSVEVLPQAISGTPLFQLELKVTRLSEAGPAVRHDVFFSQIESLPLAEESIETTLLLRGSDAALAGLFRTGGEAAPRDFAVLARLRPEEVRGDDPSAKTAEAFHLRAHDVSFLLSRLGDERPILTPDLLEKLVRSNVDPEAWRDDRTRLSVGGGGRLLDVVARTATHTKVRSYIELLLKEKAQTATLEVRAYEGPIEELLAARKAAEGGVLLAADWKPGGRLVETLRGAISGALGAEMKARGITSRGYVGDASVVSGGTGFSVTHMPDPDVRSAGDGFEVTAAIRSLRTAERSSLRLELDECRTRFGNTGGLFVPADIGPAVLPPPAAPPKPGEKDEAGAPALPSTVWIPYSFELPRQQYWKCGARLALSAGRPAILKLEDLGEGFGRMVIASFRLANALEGGR